MLHAQNLLQGEQGDADDEGDATVLKDTMHGHGTSFTYVVGLNGLSDLRDGVRSWPRSSPSSRTFRCISAQRDHVGPAYDRRRSLGVLLRARREMKRIFEPTGLRPAAWECYRPLWYYTFADESLVA